MQICPGRHHRPSRDTKVQKLQKFPSATKNATTSAAKASAVLSPQSDGISRLLTPYVFFPTSAKKPRTIKPKRRAGTSNRSTQSKPKFPCCLSPLWGLNSDEFRPEAFDWMRSIDLGLCPWSLQADSVRSVASCSIRSCSVARNQKRSNSKLAQMKRCLNSQRRPAFGKRTSATATELPRKIRDFNYFRKTSADAR